MTLGILERVLGIALWTIIAVTVAYLVADLFVDDLGPLGPRVGLGAIAALALEYRHQWMVELRRRHWGFDS